MVLGGVTDQGCIGEIFVVRDQKTGDDKMVTCIDISTLYQEKRGSAL